jgi:hypothetical protein
VGDNKLLRFTILKTCKKGFKAGAVGHKFKAKYWQKHKFIAMKFYGFFQCFQLFLQENCCVVFTGVNFVNR